MTQQEKIRKAIMFALSMKSVASSIKSEGDDYDMKWHRRYVENINSKADELLKALR